MKPLAVTAAILNDPVNGVWNHSRLLHDVRVAAREGRNFTEPNQHDVQYNAVDGTYLYKDKIVAMREEDGAYKFSMRDFNINDPFLLQLLRNIADDTNRLRPQRRQGQLYCGKTQVSPGAWF